MKRESRTVDRSHQDDSPQRHLPLVDLLVDTRAELLELAIHENGAAMLPAGSRETLLELQRGFDRFRVEFTTDEFLHIFLNYFIRAYVNAWGVPDDHSTGIFDKVDRLAQLIARHPDCDKIVDDLLLAAPERVYQAIAKKDPQAFDPGFPIWLWYFCPFDQSSSLDFRGFLERNQATEGDTQWVNYKRSPFSSRSTDF